ncbi:FadR/GntR family transcriptional regulator [Desulfoluna butyratoxydans]|uniref:Transcription regulator hth gntr n=1 Tax=Desulfoluna butyratoxydans TaxID=231438 RepID=A0A4U8YPW9_9BACT|nr:FadR/GntR family transcriptional regulator [Desulfoluna butyratoxydans]VFQ43752.1 transcription regulator hth gntr [Desulfoluna butyratoxydans]
MTKIETEGRLFHTVAKAIAARIQSDEWPPGTRLPSERSLAEHFGVSRSCIREAIRTLSEQQIVETRRGAGTFVSEPDESALAAHLARVVPLKTERLAEIFDVRRIIEPQLAARAALHITEEQIVRLKLLVFEQEKRALAGETTEDIDQAFHLCLAEASGNGILLNVVKNLTSILTESRTEALQTPERSRLSVIAHVEVIDALERGDSAGAEAAMRRHLETVEQAVFEGEESQWPPADS